MVENISMFQDKHPNSLAKIPKITPWNKESYICSYKKCIKRAQDLKHPSLKICGVFNEVGNYIDTIIEENKIQKLEIRGQILTCNQLQVKIEDDNLKRKMEITQLEGISEH